MTQSFEKAVTKQAWKTRLEESSIRYHVIGAWVAIIFDPIFGITDYFNITDWQQVLIIRFAVSVITLVTLLLWRRYQFPSFVLVFVPFSLISLQNIYTYVLIDLSGFTGHTLNYIALWIGAGMFILWRIEYSLIIVAISLTGYIVAISLHEEFTFQEAMVNGGLLLIVVTIFTVVLIQARYSLTLKTIKARLALEEANNALETQKQLVEQKNKAIMDSIRYAERIQNATLPQSELIHRAFPEAFVFFKPRDVVSGDFYWLWHDAQSGRALIAAMDCTGHGVPGAFMSMKGDALLNQLVNAERVVSPEQILKEMDYEIRKGLKQDATHNKDGMDGTICLVDFQQRKLYFAGAKNPLIYFQEGEMHRIKGDSHPIGGASWGDEEAHFTLHEIDISTPTTFYIFSDGFQDQFGGKRNRKFLTKNFRQLLAKIHQKPMAEQHETLSQTIINYMEEGNAKQIDDILVVGVRV